MLLPNTTDDFYKFNEQTFTWVNSKSCNDQWNPVFETTFGIGSGYLISYPNNVTKNFIGRLNTRPIYAAPININCTNTATIAGGADGWNLIGNPYPSAIDWDLIANDPMTSGIDNAVYYYSSTDAIYKSYVNGIGNGLRYIPAMQGFMVHAQPGGGTIWLNNFVRTNSGSFEYNKSNKSLKSNYLEVTVTGNNNYSDQTYVYFTDEATLNFDRRYDAYKLMSLNPNVSMIYSITPDASKLSINSLPPSSTSTALPLGFKACADGKFTITASQLNTFQPDATIRLEDVKLGTSQNLMQNPVYTFSASTTDVTNRFLLHFEGSINISDQKK